MACAARVRVRVRVGVRVRVRANLGGVRGEGAVGLALEEHRGREGVVTCLG